MKIQFNQELIDSLRNKILFNFENANIEHVTFYNVYMDLILSDGHNYINMKLGTDYFKISPVFKIYKEKLSNFHDYVIFYCSPDAYFVIFNEQSTYIYVTSNKISVFSCNYCFKQESSLVSTIPTTAADNLDSFKIILNMIEHLSEEDKITFLTT